MDWIDNEVWKDCMKYINNPDLIVDAIEENQSKEDESAKQIRLLEARLSECEAERERIMDMYRTKLISFAEVEKQLEKSADKKSAIEFELSVLKSRHEFTSVPERKEAALDILNEIKKTLTSAEEISVDLKFEVIHILVKKITATSSEDSMTFKVHYAFGDLTQTVNRTVMDSSQL